MRFRRYVLRGRCVGVDIEQDAAVLGGHATSLRRGRRVGKRPLVRIAEEGLSDVRSGLSLGVAPLRSSRPPLGLICRFQLVVARRLAEQVLDRRR